MNKSLYEQLIEYSEKNVTAMHMPGHKRHTISMVNPYMIDITEINGFDNLHDAKGILAEEQDRLAKMYQADYAYILVNGSTCGNLASIYASVEMGDNVAVQKKSHKSVYNAIEVTKTNLKYTDNPETDDFTDVPAVLITSPDYNGNVLDIEAVAKNVHAAGAVLIVDCAHGAHLGFSESFPKNPISMGADAVIVSLHKTLPAFTQTAALLIKGDRISKQRLEHALEIFETSSPSYVLMSSVSICMNYLKDRDKAKLLFDEYAKRLESFYNRVAVLKHIIVESPYETGRDPSKIIIRSNEKGFTGASIADDLRNDYLIEIEMTGKNEILALSSVMDVDGLIRLSDAINALDKKYDKILSEDPCVFERIEDERVKAENECFARLKEDIGRLSLNLVTVYPPGSPVLLPDEIIGEEGIRKISEAISYNLEVTGMSEEGLLFVK